MIVHNNDHNTYPLLMHYNGHQKSVLTEEFVNLLIGDKELKVPDDLTILTYATSNIVDFCPLIKQLNKHNIKYFNLCDFYGSENWNNTLKITYLSKYLNEYEVKTKYVIVLDAIDIILSDDFYKIIDEFKKTGYKIFYGATSNRYPDVQLEPLELIQNKGYYKYLNSGTVIAETEYLKDFINVCNNNIKEKNIWNSDQYEVRKNYINYDKTIISYDYETKLFITSGKMYQTLKYFKDNVLLVGKSISSNKTMI